MSDYGKISEEEYKRRVLEEAWVRVSRGRVFDNPSFSNIHMFDFPRYSWGELEQLIKGRENTL